MPQGSLALTRQAHTWQILSLHSLEPTTREALPPHLEKSPRHNKDPGQPKKEEEALDYLMTPPWILIHFS